jgi:hypothetical protein
MKPCRLEAHDISTVDPEQLCNSKRSYCMLFPFGILQNLARLQDPSPFSAQGSGMIIEQFDAPNSNLYYPHHMQQVMLCIVWLSFANTKHLNKKKVPFHNRQNGFIAETRRVGVLPRARTITCNHFSTGEIKVPDTYCPWVSFHGGYSRSKCIVYF